MDIYYTQRVNQAFQDMHAACEAFRHEFITPEHFLCALLQQYEFNMALIDCGVDLNIINARLKNYLQEQEKVPAEVGEYHPNTSEQLRLALTKAVRTVEYSSAQMVYVPHIVKGILDLEESFAAYLLKDILKEDLEDFMSELIERYEDDHDQASTDEEDGNEKEPWRRLVTCLNETLSQHNPLIGREAELERTIQVLCRKEKNNPLHIGEPGV